MSITLVPSKSGSISLTRARGEGQLVPKLYDRNTDYYIYGGLAFVTLTRNILDVAKEHAPPSLLALLGREAGTPGARAGVACDQRGVKGTAMRAECFGQSRPQDGRQQSHNQDAFVIGRQPIAWTALCDGAEVP